MEDSLVAPLLGLGLDLLFGEWSNPEPQQLQNILFAHVDKTLNPVDSEVLS